MDPNTLPRTSILYTQKQIRALPILVALCLFFQWGCKNKSGLTKIDASPVVRTTAPATNAIDVPVSSTISAVFSDDMNPSTISGSTFLLQNDTVAITGSISYADSVATFVPVNKLSYNSTYIATINETTFSLSQGGTPVSGSISYEAGSNTATFTPLANLTLGTTYTATITNNAKDLAGNAMAEDVVWNFTTEAPAGEETDIAPLTGSIN